ncbi:hypothetical protein ACLB2K_051069 [Fragaria x ananassa]
MTRGEWGLGRPSLVLSMQNLNLGYSEIRSSLPRLFERLRVLTPSRTKTLKSFWVVLSAFLIFSAVSPVSVIDFFSFRSRPSSLKIEF